jgi:RNA polymerase sigma-54 factor
MALAAKLELRQGQQLVMTPQLQQAIRLLQLSNMELSAFVETELERNPLLERDEAEQAVGGAADDAELTHAGSEPDEAAGEVGAGGDSDDWLDLGPARNNADQLDTSLGDVFPDSTPQDLVASAVGPEQPSGWASLANRGASGSDEDHNLEGYAAAEISLKDHLLAQLQVATRDPIRLLVGQHLIDMVGETGYLTADLAEVGDKLGAPDGLVEDVLSLVQSFDPAGVAARSLGECLALQLKEQNRFDPQIAKLIDHLDLLAQHNLSALRRAIGVDMDELADMIQELKALNPKPGLRFGTVQVQPVVPDVLVRAAKDGSWIVELNNETLPRVLVNRSYFSHVSKTATQTKDRDYLNECLQTANWLVRSLDQRARTILRVAEEIVRQQDGFFTHGVQHLRPLNLKTVADAISMHESTVSRVTSNKYVATPRGIFELKYFFTSAIASAGDGEAHSSESVRHRIRQMIEAESADGVLSDDRIVELLQGAGIDIARRTVAKYREAMRIPSSVQRRREKRLSDRSSAAAIHAGA